MYTWQIQIKGLVQGVGFRPFVTTLAECMGLNGCVSNTNEGVIILINATEEIASQFYKDVIAKAPVNAIITRHTLKEVAYTPFYAFSIKESEATGKPDLLLTPDIAICEHCLNEIKDQQNKRYQYPFTTCLNCGPRYSIITDLPYDRCNTTMENMKMCSACEKEYHNIHDKRHFSQTNSCTDCSIPMHLYNCNGKEISTDCESILTTVNVALVNGHIVAVKGVGGYLLLCDATNAEAVAILRERKQRPVKPLALLYKDIAAVKQDLIVASIEKKELESRAAPIVLCAVKEKMHNSLCIELIAPGLSKIGVMLPYTGLLALIAEAFDKPLIATSGNLHRSPITYRDADALQHLSKFADLLLTFDREIVVPQDDSVIQFVADSKQKIVLRRSRGLSPNYFLNPFADHACVFAAGADLKSAFALCDHNNLYVSQFLGDLSSYESYTAYEKTANHIIQMLQAKPEYVMVDKHPNYASSAFGREMALKAEVPVVTVQHHKAHFAAVLAENNLMQSEEKILGVVWDGTGFGDDGNIWGGEFFTYSNKEMRRAAHFDYYPQLLGDRMSKEPRLSALSLMHHDEDELIATLSNFDSKEHDYLQKLVLHKNALYTSSVGRLLDGIASLLDVAQFNSFEGEAAMKLEALACGANDKFLNFYEIPFDGNVLDWRPMLAMVLEYKRRHIPTCRIAFKVFASLANCIKEMAMHLQIKKVAFSGGVFQNALLVDLIHQLMDADFDLYFHQQLSPNDECIGFGQAAYFYMHQQQKAFKAINNLSEQVV